MRIKRDNSHKTQHQAWHIVSAQSMLAGIIVIITLVSRQVLCMHPSSPLLELLLAHVCDEQLRLLQTSHVEEIRLLATLTPTPVGPSSVLRGHAEQGRPSST